MARWTHTPLSWSKVEKKWLRTNENCDGTLLCCHLLAFQNEAWSSLVQLNVGCDTPPSFPLVPLTFDNLAFAQMYTKSFGEDCILFRFFL